MIEITPTKLKRIYKAMEAIAENEVSYNPLRGHIWFYNGWLYATDSFSCVRVQLPWLENEGEWNKLYAVEGIDELGRIDFAVNAVADRYNNFGFASRLADLFEPDMKEPVIPVGTDCQYLLPVLKVFSILKTMVTFTQDNKLLFLSGTCNAKFAGCKRLVRIEAIVCHVRLA